MRQANARLLTVPTPHFPQCKDVSADMRKEISEVLKYADERRFDGVDMPENCVIC
jgi:hypothetical protein